MFEKYVFGYGSLLSKESIEKTCPTAEIVEIYFLKDYVRVFNKDASTYSALNLVKKVGEEIGVNGVVLKITDELEYEKLLAREHGYDEIVLDHPEFTLITFISEMNYKKFDFSSERQLKYFKTCLDGAQSQGDDFLDHYLKTTLIIDKKLNELLDNKDLF